MLKHYVKIKSKGQSLAEYGLILALVAVVCIVGLTTMGEQLNAMIERLAAEISGQG
jgi:pilus assembly protein Flp/PilA